MPHEPDKLEWRWCSTGCYSTSSAYSTLFIGKHPVHDAKELCKVCAPSKCMFFIWLIMHDRCWTSDWLQRHGLQNHGSCALCSQDPETIDHLFGCYAFVREVWFKALRWCSWQHLTPSREDTIVDWWHRSRKAVTKPRCCAFDSLVCLVICTCWLQRNDCVF
jgi:hypothetical protein